MKEFGILLNKCTIKSMQLCKTVLHFSGQITLWNNTAKVFWQQFNFKLIGWHSHSRSIMHEPSKNLNHFQIKLKDWHYNFVHFSETSVKIHQESLEDWKWYRSVPSQRWQSHDIKAGLPIHEPYSLWPHSRHAGCTCSK